MSWAELEQTLEAVAAETGFSGVVRIEAADDVELERAFGEAHRGYGIPNAPDTRFGIASGTKTLTALVVVNLVEEGVLALDTPARELLGSDLPLVADDVTIEHLLSHTSGIGDYLDEETDVDLNDYLVSVPVQRLSTTEDYLPILEGHPTKFVAGARFGYCNSGYVILALIAERASGRALPELVAERVCAPAGMVDTVFLRSDEPDGRTALGYLAAAGLRTNVLHLPVRGTGDGGAQTTVRDIGALWRALFEGRLVSPAGVVSMTTPRSGGAGGEPYGLGFWLDPPKGLVACEGCDTGVSFRSSHREADRRTLTVISNTTDGAWPVSKRLTQVIWP